MIIAGNTVHIDSKDEWVILDIGFSNAKPTCGLMINQGEPKLYKFRDAINEIYNFIFNSTKEVNLVIEAPLSVAFDAHGNPKGRSIEKQRSKTRYWYTGLGCSVLVPSLYLIVELNTLKNAKIRLFEGFVSFKDSNSKSDHIKDVKLLRNIIDEPKKNSKSIIAPEQLKMDVTDRLESAFLVTGINIAIPPVIRV